MVYSEIHGWIISVPTFFPHKKSAILGYNRYPGVRWLGHWCTHGGEAQADAGVPIPGIHQVEGHQSFGFSNGFYKHIIHDIWITMMFGYIFHDFYKQIIQITMM